MEENALTNVSFDQLLQGYVKSVNNYGPKAMN